MQELEAQRSAKRTRLMSCCGAQRQKLVGGAAEEVEARPQQHPLAAIIAEWFSTQAKAIALKLKPTPRAVLQLLPTIKRVSSGHAAEAGAKASPTTCSDAVAAKNVPVIGTPATVKKCDAPCATPVSTESAKVKARTAMHMQSKTTDAVQMESATTGATEVEPEVEAAWAMLEEAQESAEYWPTLEVPGTAFEALAALQETQPAADQQQVEQQQLQWQQAPAQEQWQAWPMPTGEDFQLPGAWQVCFDEEHGAYYYHNQLTGMWQWEAPASWQ
jgi:hypothetical protein